jgi:hypothetical protein
LAWQQRERSGGHGGGDGECEADPPRVSVTVSVGQEEEHGHEPERAALGRLVAAALLLGFVATAIVGLVLIARHGLEARKQAIPLGPFLAFGAIATLFLATPGHT